MDYEWSTGAMRTSVSSVGRASPLLEMLPAEEGRRVMVIADSEVSRLWGERLDLGSLDLIEAGPGEKAKDPACAIDAWRRLHSGRFSREDTIVGVGGGAVCDLAAFVASTWHRGMGLALLPTTTLAMVDACLGGKTAIDIDASKNQVGTFYPAGSIVLCPEFLQTLPERHLRSGLAEAVKTSLIGDRDLSRAIADMASNLSGSWLDLALDMALRCLRIKAGVVEPDLTDSSTRRILNVGHTIGHALESASGFELMHGEAVAAGMVIEAGMASLIGGSDGLVFDLRSVLFEIGLPAGMPLDLDPERILSFLSADKKTGLKGRTWALPMDWEDCRLVRLDPATEEDLVRRTLERLP